MDEPLIIRASMTSQYNDCGLRAAVSAFPWLFKQLGYEPRMLRPGIAAAVGTGAHGAVAHSLGEKLISGCLAPESESVEAGISAFDEEIKDGVEPDKTTPDKNTAHKQIQRITRSFNTIGYKLEPKVIEQRFNARFPGFPGFEASGRFDIIDEPGPRRYRILDFKSGRHPSPYPYQTGLYAVIADANKLALGIDEISELGEVRVPRSGAREMQPDPVLKMYDLALSKQMGVQMFKRIARDVRTFTETQEPMVSFPANSFSMFCREQSCPAWGTAICSLWSDATNKNED